MVKILKMSRVYLFLIIAFSLSISAQNQQAISQDYLDSLPEDIKEDVMLRMNEKNSVEKKVYRSIDSSSDLKKDEAIDEDISEIFGSDFFDTIQTSFMPINSPNMDDSYIVDFGDVLKIQLTGQNSSIDSYQIERDGSINLSEIGKLYVSGLSLSKVSDLVSLKVSQSYIGTEAYVSLENIRDISILVSGEAFNPGIYTLNGNSNMLHALHVAGGISNYGSYRDIRLIRDKKIIDNLDIYDILTSGGAGSNIRLRTGDVVFVGSRGNVVNLEGAFKRIHRYELLPNEFLSDAVRYANGTSYDADFSTIYLNRLLDGKYEDIPITNISQFKNIKPYDQDRIFIRRHSFRNVQITGSVVRPGSYKMVEGETIHNLIDRAGGYTENAYPEGAIYNNISSKEINTMANERLYREFINRLIEIMQLNNNPSSDFSSLSILADELRNTESNGRIIIDLFDKSNPVFVQDNDTLLIPEKSNSVYIFGEIINPGSLIYKANGDLDFYLNEASGLKDSADDDSIFILLPNGRTSQFSRKRNIFVNQSKSINIPPGSVIFVPRKITNSNASRLLVAQAYATILGNLGLSVASINAIKNN